MKQESKDLLLKYLSMALPYGVILSIGIFDNGTMKYHNEKFDYHSKLLSLIELEGAFSLNGLLYKYSQFIAKPYLRPMSSMTDEEKKEMYNLLSPEGTAIYGCDGISMPMNHYGEFVPYEFMNRIIQYLIKNHFDFIGLIPKGLEIEVTDENNPY